MARQSPAPSQTSCTMNFLLDKEKELMKLNNEIDERNKKIGSESPQKRSMLPRARASAPKQRTGSRSRPVSRANSLGGSTRDNKEREDGEKFVWAPLSNQPNTYIWAPLSQEDLHENGNISVRNVKPKKIKKHQENSVKNSCESIVEKASTENPNNSYGDDIHNGEGHTGDMDGELSEFCDDMKNSNNKAEQTQMRMLNVKIRGLETALDKLNFEKSEVSQEKDQLDKEIKIIDDQRRRLDVTNRNLSTQLEKNKGELEDVRHKFSVLEEDNSLLKKEIEDAKKESKKNLSKKSSSDIRLNRALEEAAKLRGQLQAAERDKKDAIESGKKSVDELTLKTKFLEKQRNELLTGFKKQMELIDVLKRQKLHLEAAHVLKYTEEEFMQTLDWKPGQTPGAGAGQTQAAAAGN